MTRPIQQLAPGYLGLLGLKSQGLLPPEVVDAVAPVLEMGDFYKLGPRETFNSTAGVNVLASASYGFPELLVPANEVWWVHAYSVVLAIPAGQSWKGNVVQFTGNFRPMNTGAPFSGGGAAIENLQLPSLNGFWARQGDRFGVFTGVSTGAGAINAFGELTISRFPS